MKQIKPTYCKHFFLIAISLLLLQTKGLSQASRKTASQIGAYISAAKANTEKPDISKLLDNQKKHKDVLLAVQIYYSDTLYTGVIEAYKLTYEVARRSIISEIKQSGIEAISLGIQNNNRAVAGYCVQHLSVFAREDFNAAAKNTILSNLQTGTPKLDELIMLAGYLNLPESATKIETLASTTRNTSEKWAAWLSLARMGNEKYIRNVAETVRKQTLNDDIVYELVPGLIYTRQKVAIDAAIEILYNDKKACYSSSPDNPIKIQCGYRVMEYIAPVIKDFPYGVKTSGDIETDNYEQALTDIREWFLEKGSSYEVIDVSF